MAPVPCLCDRHAAANLGREALVRDAGEVSLLCVQSTRVSMHVRVHVYLRMYVHMYVLVNVPKNACAPVSRICINASCDIYRCTKTTGALHVHFFVQFLRSQKRLP